MAKGEKAERSEGDQFESDPGAVYARRRTELLGALSAPGMLDHDWVMPFGTLPGPTMGGIAFIEHLTHGWDVAKATGQDVTIPPDLVDEGMKVVTPMGDFLRMPGVFGPARDVPERASAQDGRGDQPDHRRPVCDTALSAVAAPGIRRPPSPVPRPHPRSHR